MNDFTTVATEDAALDAVRAFYESFNDGDVARLDTALSEDWDEAPRNPGQEAGREPMKGFISWIREMVPDLAIEVQSIIVSKGEVGVRAELTGSHTSELLGLPPTGRRFAIRLHEFHSVRGGRITFTWHMEDWLSFLVQVGAWPPARA